MKASKLIKVLKRYCRESGVDYDVLFWFRPNLSSEKTSEALVPLAVARLVHASNPPPTVDLPCIEISLTTPDEKERSERRVEELKARGEL